MEGSTGGDASLQGKRIALVGRLASMSRREAAQHARRLGAVVVDAPDPTVDLVVLGEEDPPLSPDNDPDAWFDAETRQAAEQGRIEIVAETRFLERLGLLEPHGDIHRLYTPAMLAELLRVPVAVIRRWVRRRLIVPVREVRRLPYFDFQEVAAARRLAQLLAAGTSPANLEKKLAALARWVPDIERPLAQLSVIVEGKNILLRQGDGLVEPGGQLRFNFDAERPIEPAPPRARSILALADAGRDLLPPASPEEIADEAAALEDQGRLDEAIEMYRAALAAGGPSAEICFQLAELLYQTGDRTAARERYYMAVELDEDYVEARANLGCLLAEMGQQDLAIAALEGALAYHADYADAHYHLGRVLDAAGRPDAARSHWRAFLDLAPKSPWAEHARERLAAGS